MGISQVNQIVKKQPSAFVSPIEFESKYHTKVCPLTLYGMTSTLRELWRNKKLPSIPPNCKDQETFTTAFLKSKKSPADWLTKNWWKQKVAIKFLVKRNGPRFSQKLAI